jgi:hypothetical protein
VTSSELSIIGSDAVNGSSGDEPAVRGKSTTRCWRRQLVIPSFRPEQAIAITSASIKTRRLDEAGWGEASQATYME